MLTLRERAVGLLVAPSLPALTAGGEVLWSLWRAETDLPHSVWYCRDVGCDAELRCVQWLRPPWAKPSLFSVSSACCDAGVCSQECGVVVLAPVSVVFSVDIHYLGSGKAKEGKCQKPKPSFEEYDLCEGAAAWKQHRLLLLSSCTG